ncbi:MAG: TIGR02996 domain-containing protein [Gemmataceae bacterium]
MSEFVPLLIGDEVEATRGHYAGRRGRVSEISEDGKKLSVWFGQRHETPPGGGSLVITEAGDFPTKNFLFRGEPASRAVVSAKRFANPPPCEPGLEATALANIWDDTVRLVLADWLDEQSDPHAEYLRVQVSLSKAVRNREPFETLAERERRLRAVLNPEWVSRFRRLTTEPLPFDIAAIDRGYAAHARTAIRLHPRVGDVPELAASKVGGLFLWPEDEPWPTAAGVTVDPDFGMWGPFPEDWSTVPLVPILQLNRRDVPNLAFPPGKDLLQVFWCPFTTSMHAPEPIVFWRDSADAETTPTPTATSRRRLRIQRHSVTRLSGSHHRLPADRCRISPRLPAEWLTNGPRLGQGLDTTTGGIGAPAGKWAAIPG